jgi:CRP-like cAMP-binding protein
MAKRPKHNTSSPNAAPQGPTEHQLQNAILLALPRQESDAILAKLEFVDLPIHFVLNEIGEAVEDAYFINGGVASILNVMSDGKSVEVGLTGKEGFVGLPLLVGFETSPTQAVMQIHGTGYRISAAGLAELLERFPALRKCLNQFSYEMTLQATQIAACNRLHPVDERLARWLLMSADRMGSPSFPLTQQFLAHMLGTRRASVTVAAGILQKAGLITYKRGQVNIEKRGKLEEVACECYAQLVRQVDSWHKHVLRNAAD